MAETFFDEALKGLAEAQSSLPKLWYRIKNHVPCFLISDGLLRHWRSKVYPHLDLSTVGFARIDTFQRPQEEERLFTTDWHLFQWWMGEINACVEAVAAPLGKTVMPGIPTAQNGPAVASQLRKAWEAVVASINWQYKHWDSEDARRNEAPEINFTNLHFIAEGCERWLAEAVARIETAKQLLAMSQRDTNVAIKSAKLKTPKKGREGQVMSILKDEPGLNQAEVANRMGLDRSALSRGRLKTAFQKAKALYSSPDLPTGHKKLDGSVEAYAEDE